MSRHVQKSSVNKKAWVALLALTVLLVMLAYPSIMAPEGWALGRWVSFFNGGENQTSSEEDPSRSEPDHSEPENSESQVDQNNDEPIKIAYLTFDDGPSQLTPQVLDILKDYDIKATFFVIGRDSEFGHSIYRRIVAEGHVIGNHTYSHDYSLIYRSQEGFMNDFHELEDLLDRVIGIRPRIMRFPGGSANRSSHNYAGPNFMNGMIQRILMEGYLYFDWNVDSTDSSEKTPSVESIVSAVIRGVRGKDEVMVLFHDSVPKTTTVKALPAIIDHLIQEGFIFRVITEESPGFRWSDR